MSTFKKLLALTLALAMVLSVSAFAGYSADTYADADKIDSDCEDAVELLYALDIMKGDGKNFNPEASVTRAEMAKMIYVVLNYGDDDKAANYTGAKLFSDVPAGAWYEGYVNYCGTTKLVQGRPDGTFGPMDPVTCAEAAKMLLTAIGYTAEERGYTGANWANNVLSDAAIVGLLEDYNYNTNTYAPRQWIAVMMENALWADTYKTVRPVSFNGLLTSGIIGKYDEEAYTTMGKKYYGLAEFEAVAIATENASIDKYDPTGTENDKEFASDYVLFSNGKEIKGTGLGAMDLGQTYRVIHDGKTAYSVRSLYETAEARILDIEAEVVYGTSSNKANNKYEFTVDGVTAKFAAKEINVLKTRTEGYANAEKSQTGAGTITVTEFYNLIDKAEKTNDQYKIILNDDGEIAYMIVTEYDYAIVNKDGSHNKYGDYIVVDKDVDSETKDLLKFNDETNLYLEDCIITEDEIVEDNVVKFTWDLDEGKYAMEVLPLVEDVVYEARDNKAKIYTIGGDDYYVAKKVLTDVQEWLDEKDNLDEEICLVVDGDMIVYHWFSDSNIDNMDDINAKLVVVVDVDGEYSTDTLHEKEYIEYMTIDGETQIAEYQNKTGYVQFTDLEGLALKKTMTETDLEGRLFIIHEGTKGRVYLEELVETKDDEDEPNEQLDASSSLLNLYEVKTAELDATGSAVKYDDNTMAADNSFFYAYIDDGDAVFGVITPAEMGDGEDDAVYGQTLSYVKSPSGRQTVLGGYIVVDLVSDKDADYLYITKVGKETADGIELTVQVIGADEEQTIYVDDDQNFYTDLVYAYTYKTMDDEWTLELVDEYDAAKDGNSGMADWNKGFWANRTIKWYDEEYTEIYLAHKQEKNDYTMDVSDDDYVDHIVITTIEYVRDETQSEEVTGDDSDYLNADLYEEYDRTLEVVAYDELTEDMIANDTTDSYVQTGYWYYSADADMLYVVVVRDMTQAQ